MSTQQVLDPTTATRVRQISSPWHWYYREGYMAPRPLYFSCLKIPERIPFSVYSFNCFEVKMLSALAEIRQGKTPHFTMETKRWGGYVSWSMHLKLWLVLMRMESFSNNLLAPRSRVMKSIASNMLHEQKEKRSSNSLHKTVTHLVELFLWKMNLEMEGSNKCNQ